MFPDTEISALKTPRGARTYLGAAVFFGLAIFLQLLRVGLGISLDSLWAEDGQVFLQEAMTHNATIVGGEYSGYLVVFERLVAEVASLLPVRSAPIVFSTLAAAAVALSGITVWHASKGHIRDANLRAVLTTATVLAPVAGLESISSASYAPWYMVFASFWLILWRPRTWFGAVSGAGFLALTTLSNPLMFLYMPVALLRILVSRGWRDALPVSSYLVAVIPQAATAATTNYDAVEPFWGSEVWAVLLQRVAEGSILGLRLGGVAWSHLGWTILVLSFILIAAGFILGLSHSVRRVRILAGVAITLGLVAFVFTVYQRGLAVQMKWPAGSWSGDAGRYAILPVLLVISAAFATIDGLRTRVDPRSARLLGAGAMAIVLVSIASSYRFADPEVRGMPPWGAAVDQATRECQHRPSIRVAQIPISPPGFVVTLPCGAIES
ncbi:MAG TPA: hypothetical protein VFU11_08710 [Solirubrobacterales bacterium]|nr:hypothetical protein [Solirubrobacterales bacterium]